MAEWQTKIMEKLWSLGAIIIDFIDDVLDEASEILKAGAEGLMDAAGALVSGYDILADWVDWAFSYAAVKLLRRFHEIRMELLKYRRQILSGALYFIIAGSIAVFCYATFIDFSYAYNGKTLGIVKEQRDVLEIVDLVSDELTQEYGLPVAIDGDTDITFTPIISYGKEVDDMDAVLKKFTYMGDIQTTAFGIVVDGVRIGYVQAENVGLDIVQDYKKQFLNKKESAYVSVEILEDIVIEEVDTTLSRISSEAAMLNVINAGTTKEFSYTVLEGDTLDDAAKALDVKRSDLRKKNISVIGEDDQVEPGTVLTIEKNVPVISVKTVDRETYAEKVPFETEIVKSDQYYKGDEFVQTQGEDGKKRVTAEVTRINGEETGSEVVETEIIKEPVNKVIVKGTKEKPKTVGTGTFIRPVNVGIYSGYGWRWGRMHEGIDLACSTGTPIHAADGGTVKVAGWYYAYGLAVVIDHGGGVETLYGHCSSLNVSVGDKVYQGQTIAKVGSTGRSTGPHCHFEIKINGQHVNPADYV